MHSRCGQFYVVHSQCGQFPVCLTVLQLHLSLLRCEICELCSVESCDVVVVVVLFYLSPHKVLVNRVDRYYLFI